MSARQYMLLVDSIVLETFKVVYEMFTDIEN